MIYFFQHRSGRVKIGHSDTPIRRLYQLETKLDCAIVPLALMPGNRPAEQALHARFEASRDYREWFDLTPDLAAFIKYEAIPWPQLEPLRSDRNHPDPDCCYNQAVLCWLLWAHQIVEPKIDGEQVVEVIGKQVSRHSCVLLDDATIVRTDRSSMIQPGPLGSSYRHVGHWQWSDRDRRAVLLLERAALVEELMACNPFTTEGAS